MHQPVKLSINASIDQGLIFTLVQVTADFSSADASLAVGADVGLGGAERWGQRKRPPLQTQVEARAFSGGGSKFLRTPNSSPLQALLL